MAPQAGGSTPMLHVSDVRGAIHFSDALGSELIDTQGDPPGGEMRVVDPDDQVIFVGHWGDAEHEAWLRHLAARKASGA